jgi:hypothetical protein
MGKLLLNMTPGEPLALVNKLPYVNNPIELYFLLTSALFISVHDPVDFGPIQCS